MSFLQSKAVHGFGGFLLMGGWAFFANRAHEMPAPLIAGVVQGLLTATITLFLKRMIEGIFHRTAGTLRLVLPSLAAFVISSVLLTVIHILAGTPALLATILIPLTVSTLYAFLYTQTLSRHV
jgi:heme exporter protein D